MPQPRFRLVPLALATTLALCALIATAARAQSAEASVPISLAAQPLGDALNELARQARLQLLVRRELVEGKTAPAVAGTLTASQALDRLLKGSGLAVTIDGATVTVHSAPAGADVVLPTVHVGAEASSDDLPKPFAGGQVARGSSVGLLGDRDVFDTPFNITTVTSRAISDLQARSVGEALVGDASVRAYLPQSFMEQYTFRGFVIFNDDVSFNGLTGLMPISTIDSAAIERLEIFKGPSSMVSGVTSGQSIGGTMNIVPKRAPDTPVTQLSFDYANKSRLGSQVDLARRFGENKAFGIRFNGTYRDGDLTRDETSQRNTNGVVALDWRGPQTRVSIDAGKQKITSNGVGAFVVAGALTAVPAPPSNTANIFQPWMHVENSDRFAMAKVEHDITDDITVHASAGESRYEERQINATPTITANDGTLLAEPYWRKDFGRRRAAEAGASWHFATGSIEHRASLSYNYFDAISGDVYQSLPTPAISFNIANPLYAPAPADLSSVGDMPPGSSYSRLNSVGIADAIDVADKRVQIVVGARLQSIEAGSISDGVRDQSYKKSRVTPMLGVVFKPIPVLSLYANYIEGLQQGDTVSAPYVNVGEVFAPFHAKQIELGTKWDLGDVGLTVDVFQISKPNEIATPVFDGVQPADQRITLDGEQRNRGLEVSLFGEPIRGVRWLGGVMLLDGKLVKTEGGANDGNRAVGAPIVNLNFGVDWDLPWLPGLSLNAGVVHTGSQYLNAANSLQIPSWTTADLGGRYRITVADRPVTFRAHVYNLFDRVYWASTARGFGMSQGQPRQVQVSATIDF